MVLDIDQNCPISPALSVMGPVNLNLDGHKVKCVGNLENGIGVFGTGGIIRNGVVGNCLNGMLVTGRDHKIRGMLAVGNTGDGFTHRASEREFKDNAAISNEPGCFDSRGQGNNSCFINIVLCQPKAN